MQSLAALVLVVAVAVATAQQPTCVAPTRSSAFGVLSSSPPFQSWLLSTTSQMAFEVQNQGRKPAVLQSMQFETSSPGAAALLELRWIVGGCQSALPGIQPSPSTQAAWTAPGVGFAAVPLTTSGQLNARFLGLNITVGAGQFVAFYLFSPDLNVNRFWQNTVVAPLGADPAMVPGTVAASSADGIAIFPAHKFTAAVAPQTLFPASSVDTGRGVGSARLPVMNINYIFECPPPSASPATCPSWVSPLPAEAEQVPVSGPPPPSVVSSTALTTEIPSSASWRRPAGTPASAHRSTIIWQITNTGAYAVTIDAVRVRASASASASGATLRWALPAQCTLTAPVFAFFAGGGMTGSAAPDTAIESISGVTRARFILGGVRLGVGQVMYLQASFAGIHVFETGGTALGSTCASDDYLSSGCGFDSLTGAAPNIAPMTVVDYTVYRDDTSGGCSASPGGGTGEAEALRQLPACARAASTNTKPVPVPASWVPTPLSAAAWTVRNAGSENIELDAMRIQVVPGVGTDEMTLHYVVGSSRGCADRLPRELPSTATRSLWDATMSKATPSISSVEFILPSVGVPVGATVSFYLTSRTNNVKAYTQPGAAGFDAPLSSGQACASDGTLVILCGYAPPIQSEASSFFSLATATAAMSPAAMPDFVAQYHTACSSDSSCAPWSPFQSPPPPTSIRTLTVQSPPSPPPGPPLAVVAKELAEDLGTKVIAGIAAAAVVGLIILIVTIVLIVKCCNKKKKKGRNYSKVPAATVEEQQKPPNSGTKMGGGVGRNRGAVGVNL